MMTEPTAERWVMFNPLDGTKLHFDVESKAAAECLDKKLNTLLGRRWAASLGRYEVLQQRATQIGWPAATEEYCPHSHDSYGVFLP
jgi:hypothetical protein